MASSTTTRAAVAADCAGKIAARTAHIGVIGLGYVGLPLVLLFSEEKFPVTGFDIDAAKIEALSRGESYIAHIVPAQVQSARARGFTPTADFAQIAGMDVVIICVPTPLDEFRQPDMRYIVGTAESIAPCVHPGQLIILESTTYPGTTEEVLVPLLEKGNRLGLKAARNGQSGDDLFYVAFSPEREDPGRTDISRHDIPKVVGGLDAVAADLACAAYGAVFRHTVRVSTPAAAEMCKLLENIYRCVNVAMVNELKLLCLRMGIDIWEVIEAARTKPFGFQAFYPGPGLGGHCIPVDPYYLSWKAKEFDFRTRFIELAGDINTAMPYHVVTSVAGALNRQKKALSGAKVLVLGVAYKKNVGDLRESPALTIIELLQREGAAVSYNDPHVPSIGKGRKYDLQMASTPLENLQEYDCVLIVTDHSAYDYPHIVRESRLVVDARNATAGIDSSNIVRC